MILSFENLYLKITRHSLLPASKHIIDHRFSEEDDTSLSTLECQLNLIANFFKFIVLSVPYYPGRCCIIPYIYNYNC